MLRIASVPCDHPYVDHLSEPEPPGGAPAGKGSGGSFGSGRRGEDEGGMRGPHVTRLPDPPVTAEDGSTRWWPPRMLDPEWLRDHAAEFDVLHVHFGFESFTPEHLREVVETVHALGKGVVVTVHDLRNPHVQDADAQLDRLDALVPPADAVITLTHGAAQVIRERWGRDAVVVPHPHVVPLDVMAQAQARVEPGAETASRPGAPEVDAPGVVEHGADVAIGARGGASSATGAATREPVTETGRTRIGLHLKSLRRNVDAVGALDALAFVADQRRDAEIVVTLHRSVTEPSDRGYAAAVAERAEALAARGAITLVLHEPMDDTTLFAHVGRLDISVMANVWGTHSGWIEMCHDLGVRVVAPDIGFYGEQHTPALYDLADDAEAIDPSRLAAAIIAAMDELDVAGRPAPASVAARRAERSDVAQAHAAAYRAAIDTARV